jgi:hypothetical protein
MGYIAHQRSPKFYLAILSFDVLQRCSLFHIDAPTLICVLLLFYSQYFQNPQTLKMLSSIPFIAALLFSTALGIPFEPLSIRNFDQHMCTLRGWTTTESMAPEAPGEFGGGVSSAALSWGMTLSNESGLEFWTCVNEGKCNPRAMSGRTVTKGMTKTNTEVFWEPYGDSMGQCRCIVDGKTYEGVVDSEITHGGTGNENQQDCTCTSHVTPASVIKLVCGSGRIRTIQECRGRLTSNLTTAASTSSDHHAVC